MPQRCFHGFGYVVLYVLLLSANISAQSSARQQEAELNAVYTDILKRLPPPQRRQLITAERAWVAYKEKNEDFLDRLQKAGLLLEATNDQSRSMELANRTNYLRGLLVPAARGYTNRADEAAPERNLNQQYQACLQKLSPELQKKLRETQRLWVVYRETNRQLFPNQIGPITWSRVADLRRFEEVANVPESTIPNPFERAK